MNEENLYKNKPWKEYLTKDFSAELNYKLWSTKGTRFCAHHRFKKKNRLSTASVGFLSAYIIIVNLFGFLPEGNTLYLSPVNLTIITISLSVLVLVFSQLEMANNYSLTADKFHRCARDIAKLYNEWRYAKTYFDDKAKSEAIKDITRRYERILDIYDNHDDIDHQIFQTKYNDFYELNEWDIILVHCKYYLKVQLFYHALIILPIIIFILSLIIS